MKKVWKALKGGSPTRNGYSKNENGRNGGGSGTESMTGKGPPSLQDGTIYTSVLAQDNNLQQQMMMEPPPRVNLPMRVSSGQINGEVSVPYHVEQHQQQQPQQQVVYVNEQGHRVTATTVRVPPPGPTPAPPSSPATQASAAAAIMMVGGDAGIAGMASPGGNVVSTFPPQVVRQPFEPSSLAAAACADPIHIANETTRSLVKKFIADIWNRGEIDLIPEVCSPNLRFNGNTGFDRIGHDGLARMVATIRDALDEYHCEIHSMVVENNKAFCRLRFTGKHTGPLLGYPPTGKVVAWMGATEFTCQNGRILKVWELGDVKSLEEQLQPTSSSSTPVEEDEI
jgi:steroid delta-isomerase-like uncharacterized protein